MTRSPADTLFGGGTTALGDTYVVYGGFVLPTDGQQGFNPETIGYTQIGTGNGSTGAATFSGAFDYYILLATEGNAVHLDSVQGSDGQFYDASLSGNVGDLANLAGAADGLFALLNDDGPSWNQLESRGYVLIDAAATGLTSITVTAADPAIVADNSESFAGLGGNDTIDGGDGVSTVDYAWDDEAGGHAGVSVNLSTGTAIDGFGSTDTLVSIENVRGTEENDLFVGDGNDNRFEGGGGFDSVDYANTTGSIVFSVPGNAQVTGDASVGTDMLIGIERVFGGNGSDTFTVTGSGFFEIEGGGGVDQIIGNGNTRIGYSRAAVGVTVDLAAGTAIDGQGGVDIVSNISQVRGSAHDDTLIGGGLNFESFRPGAGDDNVNGGSGTDRIDYQFDPGAVTVDLAAGTALDGYGGTDTLANIEDIWGSEYADSLTGNGATNVLQGFGGDDTLNGGAGFDVALYSSATASVVVALSTTSTVSGDASVGTDTLTGIERVVGSGFDDTFTADGGFAASNGSFNEFEGAAGNDVVTGNGNTRISYSGATSGVTVDLEAGTATGDASVGTDTITGGVRHVRGSSFDDFLLGSTAGGERFRGQGGDDLIYGGGGREDTADYSFDPTAVFVDLGSNLAQDGFGGTDTLFSIDRVEGSAFADTLIGDSGENVLVGNGGDDLIDGDGEFDTASYYNATAGIVVSLSAVSTVMGDGSVGTDTLIDIERIYGSDHDDVFIADVSFSALFGSFNDFEGAGGDDLIAGNGNTRISYVFATSGVNVSLATGSATGDASVGTDTIVGGVNSVRGSAFGDVLTGSTADFERLRGGAGIGDLADYFNAPSAVTVDLSTGMALDGHGNTDTLVGIENIRGSDHNDLFVGDGNDNVIEGLSGYDSIDYSNAAGPISFDILSSPTVVGGMAVGTDTLIGIERIYGTGFADTFNASGNDFFEFEGGAGDDTITGNGNTRIGYGRASSAATVDLSSGSALDGEGGNDTLSNISHVRGSAHDDMLIGGGAQTFESFCRSASPSTGSAASTR